MIKRSMIIASLIFCCSNATAATEISGVNIPDNISMQQKVLTFNGAGVRSKFFIDLYVGSLFTNHRVKQASEVVNGEQDAAIRLNITSGMITSKKMIKAMNEGFDRATDGDPSAITASIKEFMNGFLAPIEDGDQFTILSLPGKGIISYKNGKQLSEIDDEPFRQAVMAIWLGKNPTDSDLKEDMLQQ